MIKEFDLTEYLDTSKNNLEITERIGLDKLLSKLFISASGKMEETEGWFAHRIKFLRL